MTIPTKIEDWTFEVIKDITHQGVFETDRFDFKEKLPDGKNNASKQRLRKTLAAFANTDGGFLIFGVKDGRNLSTDDRLIGLGKTYELPRHFGNYPAQCEPSVEWVFRNPAIAVPGSEGLIQVVEIPPSRFKPHAVREGVKFIFPKRTNKGNEDMSYTEVRQAFHETEFRRTTLSLLLAELGHIRKSAKRVVSNIPDPVPQIDGTLHWAWANHYSTMLLDSTLGNAFHFLSDDSTVWEHLCIIRDEALHANTACEGLKTIVYHAISKKSQINEAHYKLVRSCAVKILDAIKQVVPRIEALLK